MEARQTALDGESPDEAAVKQQVLEACQKFQDALLETVNQNPENDAAIGAYAFRETFRYFMLGSRSVRCILGCRQAENQADMH